MTERLVLDHLSKWYGEVVGVHDLTVAFKPGVTGLLGPNGAGKSTLLNLLAGRIKPSRGSVLLDGQPIWADHRVFHHIGVCPDQDSFYDDLTGLAFLTFMGRLHQRTTRDARERALEMLDTFGLKEAAEQRVGGYSKGMRQRLKLAQALMDDPSVILLDEPLQGMDPVGRMNTIKNVRRLGQEGRTILVSSHILHEIEAMTQHVCLMDHGKLIAWGDVHEIRELIASHPHEIRFQTPERDRLSRYLLTLDEVVSVRRGTRESELLCEASHPDRFFPKLLEGLLEKSIPVDELVSSDDNLEAVFDYLIGRKKASGVAGDHKA